MSDNKNVILVQGPNNKILSLKIKSPTIKTTNILSLPTKGSIIQSTDSSTLIKRNITTTSTSPSIILSQNKPIETTTTTTSSGQNEQQQLLRTINSANLKIMSSSLIVGGNTSSVDTKTVTISNPYKVIPSIQSINTPLISLPNISSNITISKAGKVINRTNIGEPSPLVTIQKKIPSILSSSLSVQKVSDEKQVNNSNLLVKLRKNDDLKKNIEIDSQTTVITQIPESPSTLTGSINQSITKPPITGIIEKLQPEEIQQPKKLLTKVSSIEKAIDSKNTENKGNPSINRMIKINLSKMMAKANNNKIKQESLLKNKILENFLRSPRTKGRSKSLNSVNHKAIKSRRLSTASESKTKDLKTVNKELLLEIQDKLDKGKMAAATENSSLESNTSNIQQNESTIYDDNLFLPQPPPLIRIGDMKLHSNVNNPTIMDVRPKLNPPSNGEVINILKWNNGIGTTKDSLMAFHLNEFGLVEIYEKTVFRDRVDICYEKPIFERESKSQNTCDYVDPLYFCKGCNCHGAAVDFLAPNYCSQECIGRYDKKKSKEHHKILDDNMKYLNNPKKITSHRKKRILGLPNLRNWQAPKSIIPVGEIETEQHIINADDGDSKTKRLFSWTTYLSSSKAEPATIDLFLNPFPCGPNLFEVGMKLEAIDPEHSSLFCVCTIAEKKGFRLKLHFDGFPKIYDFWINADSMDIFPPGWCAKTNRILQPPKNINATQFSWSSYLIKTKSPAAPRNLFTHLNSSSITNPFKVGMKFEADDLRNTRKVCVASVVDILDNRILVHFDGWDEGYDYWVDASSPYIHPVNWHKMNCFEIVPPPDWIGQFDWNTYIQQTNGIPAVSDLFRIREPIDFKPGMKLEIVDKKNPSLIRPGTVIIRDEYELKVIFDGWPKEYVFWVVDDNPDIHPIGWCEATGHELESPPGFEGLTPLLPCSMPGCRGIGNAKRFDVDYHATVDSCPYELYNWSIELEKPERLENVYIEICEDLKFPMKRKHEVDDIEIPPKRFYDAPIPESITILPDFEENYAESTQITPDSEILTKSDAKTIISPIYKQLLCDYGPRLEQNYTLWVKNSMAIRNFQTEEITENPLDWTVDQVVKYVSKIPLCKTVAEIFRRECIDGEAFLSLRQCDLTDILNLKLGPTVKIYSQVIHLRSEVIQKFHNDMK